MRYFVIIDCKGKMIKTYSKNHSRKLRLKVASLECLAAYLQTCPFVLYQSVTSITGLFVLLGASTLKICSCTLPTVFYTDNSQECIPVWCVPPACCPYLTACTGPGGVYLVPGCVPGPGGTWSGGVPGLGGVPCPRGVYLVPWGCT